MGAPTKEAAPCCAERRWAQRTARIADSGLSAHVEVASEVVPIDALAGSPEAQTELLARLARLLRAGEAVILPTDTVYGIVVMANDPAALDRVRALKGRPEHVPIAVLVADTAQASTLADTLSPVAAALAARFWPGPLTLVVPAAAGAPDVGGGGTIGIRCPDDELLRRLAADVGPLAASSANLHGEPTGATATAVAASFGDLLVVDGGERAGLASTVVDCTTAQPLIVREGPLGEAALRSVIEGA